MSEKRMRARPDPNDETVAFPLRLGARLVEAIDEGAAAQGLSRNAFLAQVLRREFGARAAVLTALAANDQQTKPKRRSTR